MIGASVPARWAAVDDERARFTAEVAPPDEATSFPRDGERLSASTVDEPALTMEGFLDGVYTEDPEPTETHAPMRVHNLVVTRRPVAVLSSDGLITVRTQSDRDLGGGRVDFGVRIRTFAPPNRVLRKTVPVELLDDGWVEAVVPVRRLLTRKHDVDRVRERGRGTVALRLRLLDLGLGAERSEDLDVPFRCAAVPCTHETPLIQLPELRLGPFVDRVTARTAVVSFETDVPTTARVVVLDADGVVDRFDAPNTARRHEIPLTGLEPQTDYRYWVFVQDGRGEAHEALEGAVRTPPEQPERFTFAVMSDSRSGVGGPESSYRGSNREALRDLSALIFQRDADFVVFVGDLINGYTTEPGAYRYELEGYMMSVQTVASRIPFYEAFGNHEALIEAWSSGFFNDRPGPENSQSIFAEVVVNPTNAPEAQLDGAPSYGETVFSFDHGSAHFAVVNSNYWVRSHHERTDHPRFGLGTREGWITDEQLTWLENDLTAARARGQRHLFVFTHEPAFPAAGHLDDAMYWNGRFPEVLQRRDAFWKLLSEQGVVAAFFGDEHSYTRSFIGSNVNADFERPVWQLVTGGAGAPYYALDESAPWIDAVRAFRPDHHFCEITVDGDRVELRVVNRLGAVIDEAVLAE